mmetsp:Transcript_46380/g.77249  ORF Transcript_46380/g.77249 Transcript_46380/m.77249 type:complete len:177 (+) Transcript_46380:33-563(+)
MAEIAAFASTGAVSFRSGNAAGSHTWCQCSNALDLRPRRRPVAFVPGGLKFVCNTAGSFFPVSGTAKVFRAPSSRRHTGQRTSTPLPCLNALFGLGAGEVAVILGVTLLIFGPSKAPELGKSFGKALKSFKNASKEFEKELSSAEEDEDEEKPEKPVPSEAPSSTVAEKATSTEKA